MEKIVLGRNVFESVEFPEEFGSQAALSNSIFKPVDVVDRYIKYIQSYDLVSMNPPDKDDSLWSKIVGAIEAFGHSVDVEDIMFQLLDAFIAKTKTYPEPEHARILMQHIIINALRLLISKDKLNKHNIELINSMIRYVMSADIEIVDANAFVSVMPESFKTDEKVVPSFYRSLMAIAEKRNYKFNAKSTFTINNIIQNNPHKNAARKHIDRANKMVKGLPAEEVISYINNMDDDNPRNVKTICGMLGSMPDLVVDEKTVDNILNIDFEQAGCKDEDVVKVWPMLQKSIKAIPEYKVKQIPATNQMTSFLLTKIAKDKNLLSQLSINKAAAKAAGTKVNMMDALDATQNRVNVSKKYDVLDNVVILILRNSGTSVIASSIFDTIFHNGQFFDSDYVFSNIQSGYYIKRPGSYWVAVIEDIKRLGNEYNTQATKLARTVLEYCDTVNQIRGSMRDKIKELAGR